MQAKPGALVFSCLAAICLAKRLQSQFQLLRVHPNARVTDPDDDRIFRGNHRGQCNAALVMREFYGVRQQIIGDLNQGSLIADEGGQVSLN